MSNKVMAVFSATKDQFMYHANDAIIKAKPTKIWKLDRTRGILTLGEWTYRYFYQPDQLRGLTLDAFTIWGQPPLNLVDLEREALYRMRR